MNSGKKCNCTNDGACNCVKADEFISINSENCDECSKLSTKSCICHAKGFRFEIPSNVTKCSSLVSTKTGEIPLDSCPYQIGVDCKCEYNAYKKTEQCYCSKLNPFQQIPSINDSQNPKSTCVGHKECQQHNKFYCCCTNSINRAYIKELTLEANDDIDQICTKRFSQPPNIACRPFGYKSECIGGRCNLQAINLYNNNTDMEEDQDEQF